MPASSDKALSISRGSTESSSGAFSCEACRRIVGEEVDNVEQVELDISVSFGGHKLPVSIWSRTQTREDSLYVS